MKRADLFSHRQDEDVGLSHNESIPSRVTQDEMRPGSGASGTLGEPPSVRSPPALPLSFLFLSFVFITSSATPLLAMAHVPSTPFPSSPIGKMNIYMLEPRLDCKAHRHCPMTPIYHKLGSK